MGDTTLMSKIMPLFTIYRNLRILERQLDELVGAHQKDPESSEWTGIDYQEAYHALQQMTNTEMALFATLGTINETQSETNEYWIDFMEYEEMHITSGNLIWKKEK